MFKPKKAHSDHSKGEVEGMWLAHSNQQVRTVTERNFTEHHPMPSNLPPPFQQTSSAQLLKK